MQTPTIATATPTTPIINDIPIDISANEMESQAAIQATDKYLSATTALVVINLLEDHSLMQFTVVVSQENLTSKANTLVDTRTSLNFASKQFLNANSFYKYYKVAPKLVVRVS
jgi:hypothetical protein